jgi:hypothetical protein
MNSAPQGTNDGFLRFACCVLRSADQWSAVVRICRSAAVPAADLAATTPFVDSSVDSCVDSPQTFSILSFQTLFAENGGSYPHISDKPA